MRTRRIASAAAAGALALGTMLAAAGPASAEDYYVVESDLSEDSASPWSLSDSASHTATFTDDGLVLEGGASIGFDYQRTRVDGAGFLALIEGMSIDSDGLWSFGALWEGAVEPERAWGIFGPNELNAIPTELDSEWLITNSEPVYTLQEVLDRIDEWGSLFADGLQVRNLGIYTGEESDPVTLRSVTIEGDTYYFTPEPQQAEEPEDEAGEVADVDEGAAGEAPPATAVNAEATFTG